ncbi:hypothetical protein KNJ79_18395 [Sphingopyxis indica]|uniref:hypothetical protein n=1 Tax=Sphingopyxis indica TaxID=436663 RepID=UPI0029390356|nr:hypothetical protein [Sphingopyxis indica]WOF43077.1 hypothetical protein KNJ79_18395 [Sphingopyxis indica]
MTNVMPMLLALIAGDLFRRIIPDSSRGALSRLKVPFACLLIASLGSELAKSSTAGDGLAMIRDSIALVLALGILVACALIIFAERAGYPVVGADRPALRLKVIPAALLVSGGGLMAAATGASVFLLTSNGYAGEFSLPPADSVLRVMTFLVGVDLAEDLGFIRRAMTPDS